VQSPETYVGYARAERFRFARAITDLNVKSVIASPGDWAAPGPIAVQGVAWSNASPVVKVEISADAGKTWSHANLLGKPTKYGFRKFAYTWRAAEGQYTLMSHATNEAGQSQPLEPEWNPNGYLYNAAQPRAVTIAKIRPASVASPEAETQPAPDGYKAACSVCHDEHMMRQQRLTSAQWDRELTKVTGWGASVTPNSAIVCSTTWRRATSPDRRLGMAGFRP
jgi:Mo-co oxidoreductase dimerisation domain